MVSTRLAGIDAAYLAAEVAGNPLHLMAILRLDPSSMPGGYSFERLRDFMRQRLPEIPPLRRRLALVPFGLDRPRWVEVDDVDLDLHVRRAALPSPGSARELSELASQINDRLLDRSRPLWEIVVVEGLESGEIALIAKLHHAMMDGMVGVRYMAALLGDEERDGEASASDSPQPAPIGSTAAPSELRLLAEAVPEVLFRPLRLARATGRTLYSLGATRLRAALAGAAGEPTEATAESTREAAQLVPRSAFNRRSCPRRQVAYTSLPLAAMKAIGRAFGATINDVVLALVAGATRRYLEERGELPTESLVAGTPASTHQKDDELANAYTLLFPTLATDLADPAARLRTICEATTGAKARARPGGGGGDLMREWVDIPPPWLYHALARLYVGIHFVERLDRPFFNVLVSSVPGPEVPLRFAGARITGIHPLGPIYDGMLLNVTAIGRKDSVDVGLVADREGVPGVWEIGEGLHDALAELELAAGRHAASLA